MSPWVLLSRYPPALWAPIKTSPIPALKPGDCPAQMIITRVEHVTTEWVEGLSET